MKFLYILLIVAVAGCLTIAEKVYVTCVIDGDTLELYDGTRVRLLGIETPEKGQMFYEESRQRLQQLVEGNNVSLERDKQNQDRFGRDLRYVFSDGNFINAILVREGFARVRIIEPNVKYSIVLYDAQHKAKENHIGVWSVDSPANCLGFSIVSAGYPEYLRVKNSCEYDIDLTGWRIVGNYNLMYMFPQFTAKGNFASFNLHSRNGTNNETDLFTGLGNQWNRNHDTIRLLKGENVVIEYTY